MLGRSSTPSGSRQTTQSSESRLASSLPSTSRWQADRTDRSNYISPENVMTLTKIFADGHAPFSVEVFKGELGGAWLNQGTVHGFGSRPAFAYEPTMKSFQAANDDAAEWLKDNLGLAH